MDTKNDTKTEKIVPQYFTVKVETMCPVTLTYSILAEDANQALEKAIKNPLNNLAGPPKPALGKMKKIQGAVYRFGHSIILLTKKLG